MEGKFICFIGLHKNLYTGSKKAVTYDPVLNPVVINKYVCKYCGRVKTKNSKGKGF